MEQPARCPHLSAPVPQACGRFGASPIGDRDEMLRELVAKLPSADAAAGSGAAAAPPGQSGGAEGGSAPDAVQARLGPLHPVVKPSLNPVVKPSLNPGLKPSLNPVVKPSLNPVVKPSLNPGLKPSLNPGLKPSLNPGLKPSLNPVVKPGGGTRSLHPQQLRHAGQLASREKLLTQEASYVRSFLRPAR